MQAIVRISRLPGWAVLMQAIRTRSGLPGWAVLLQVITTIIRISWLGCTSAGHKNNIRIACQWWPRELLTNDTMTDNLINKLSDLIRYFWDRYDISRKCYAQYDTTNVGKFRALSNKVLISYILWIIATSIRDSFGLNCHLISPKIIFKHILVLRAGTFL